MTLIELHVEWKRTNALLERAVIALEKLGATPEPADIKVQQATLDDLHTPTPEDHQRMVNEQAAFAEQHGVVPRSEAFIRELVNWDREQKTIYGENWGSTDWKAIFAAAERTRTGREPATSPDAAD